jgi:hypothetical protein
MAFVALGGGRPAHAQSFENVVDRRVTDPHVVVAPQTHLDLHRVEVLVLPETDDLLHDLGVGDGRAVLWRAGAFFEAVQPVVVVASFRR